VTSYIGDVEKMVSPDYSKVDLAPYVDNGFRFGKIAKRELPILTSYGCPHNCVFCATRTITGRKVAYRDVEDIIDEMRYLKQKYEIDAILFLDDNILADEKRAKLLFNRMIEEKRRSYCEFRGISEQDLANIRKNARRSSGKMQGIRAKRV